MNFNCFTPLMQFHLNNYVINWPPSVKFFLPFFCRTRQFQPTSIVFRGTVTLIDPILLLVSPEELEVVVDLQWQVSSLPLARTTRAI